MSIDKVIRSAQAMSSSRNLPKPTATDRQAPYFEKAQSIFMQRRGHLASNIYNGLIEDDDFTLKYRPCKFRVMPVPSPIAASQYRRDDYLLIKFLSPMGYVSLGTKIKFNSNPKTKAKDTYLAWNPENLTSDIADTQIKKCNRIWNKLDYFGNVISEPFVADDITSTAVDSAQNSSATNLSIQRDSLSCIMQCNSRTKGLKEGDRLILGGLSYSARGVINHARTITDEIDSVRLLAFTLARDQQDTSKDDLINDIVGGLDFDWTITLSATDITIIEGDTGELAAASLRNGIAPTEAYGYIWESSDPSVVSVKDGRYAAAAMGTATVTCRLRENPSIMAQANIEVGEIALDDYRLSFEPVPPASLNTYQSTDISCFAYNNGEKTAIPVTFSFSGIGNQYYSISAKTPNGFRLTANAAAPNQLKIIASAEVLNEAMTATAQIKLLGV